jgi:hypothetical protein
VAREEKQVTHKYYKATMIRGQNLVRCVIWDGVRDYESHPPVPQLCIAEGLVGNKVVIRQVRHVHDVMKVVESMLGKVPNVILWCRNNKVYRTAVEEMDRPPDWVEQSCH